MTPPHRAALPEEIGPQEATSSGRKELAVARVALAALALLFGSACAPAVAAINLASHVAQLAAATAQLAAATQSSANQEARPAGPPCHEGRDCPSGFGCRIEDGAGECWKVCRDARGDVGLCE